MYKYKNYVEEILDKFGEKIENVDYFQFIKQRITNFFSTYMESESNISRPLNTISYYDINKFLRELECSDSEKVNYYNSFKRFFVFTYKKGLSQEIMVNVNKPTISQKKPDYIGEEDYRKIADFIQSSDNPIYDKLLLGLFFYTGLSRKYINNLKNIDFELIEQDYYLNIIKNNIEYQIPLKSDLQDLISEYLETINIDELFDKFVNVDKNYLSTYVGNISKKITGKKYTPTTFSNTFINRLLASGKYIWEASKLTLENVSTIEKHIIDINHTHDELIAILNGYS